MYYNSKSEENKLYDFIIANDIAEESELDLVTQVSGFSVDTLESVIYARTGYRDVEQCLCSNEGYEDVYGDFDFDDEEDDEE